MVRGIFRYAQNDGYEGFMMNRATETLIYKGHTAEIEYSDEDECFIGHLMAIKEIVGFHGDSIPELQAAFEEAVDDYLEMKADFDE